ncbi:hypothetical protein [Metamycoplasma equirhinis]|uniref:hypothetical protein n=1 Tax=Metamycoplasma equirhinis TaxID=92402 RepID=UPI0035934B7F
MQNIKKTTFSFNLSLLIFRVIYVIAFIGVYAATVHLLISGNFHDRLLYIVKQYTGLIAPIIFFGLALLVTSIGAFVCNIIAAIKTFKEGKTNLFVLFLLGMFISTIISLVASILWLREDKKNIVVSQNNNTNSNLDNNDSKPTAEI